MEQTEMVALLVGVVGLAGVAFVVALTELIKTTFPGLDKRWWPLVSIVWGLVVNLAVALVLLYAAVVTAPQVLVVTFAVVVGLMAGLAAAGLYSGGKTALGK